MNEIPIGFKYDPKNPDKYSLEIHHNIHADYTNDIAVLLTLGTFGLLPFFHSIEADIEYVIKKNNTIILDEKDSITARVYYGWFFILIFDLVYTLKTGDRKRGQKETDVYG